MSHDKLLSPSTVAQRLDIQPAAVRRLINTGRLPAIRFGLGTRPRLRVRQQVLDAYLERVCTPVILTVTTPVMSGYVSLMVAARQTGLHVSTLYRWRDLGLLEVKPGPPAQVRLANVYTAQTAAPKPGPRRKAG